MTTQKHNGLKWRRWLAAGLLAAALVAVGILYLSSGSEQQAASAADQAQTGTIVTVELGDLSSEATASGNVVAQRTAGLTLGVAGTVAAVNVRVGDEVEAGDVLVQLDGSDLVRQVALAEQSLVIQEANLADLTSSTTADELASALASLDSARANLEDVKAGPSAAEVAAARASLASAQEAYADVVAGPDGNTTTQALASLKNAEAALQQAQAAYDKIASRPDAGMTSQSLELQQATNNYASAKAAYDAATDSASAEETQQAKAAVEQARATLQNLLDSPSAAELAAAEAQVKQAEATFNALQDGATTAQLASAQAQVEQARLNLQESRDNLADATLVAPFDGVVTAVNVSENEYASGLAVELSDPNSLEVVLSVDEMDIGDLVEGQSATITLETWPEVEIPGTVVSIAPSATAGTSGIVAYEVHISLGDNDLPVREGMTANADLVIAARNGVMVVPNQSITPDREAGKNYVTRVQVGPDGAQITEQVEVTVGLKDDDYTEITSGLQAGDRLLVATSTGSTTNTSTQSSGSGAGGVFGGMGGALSGPPPR